LKRRKGNKLKRRTRKGYKETGTGAKTGIGIAEKKEKEVIIEKDGKKD
jgi:hypothetical protein